MKGSVLVMLFALSMTASIFARADQTVYRCEANGQVTYSDTKCSNSVDKTKVDTTLPNSFSSDDAPAHSAKKETKRKTSTSIAEEQIHHKERCKDLAEKLDEISTKEATADLGRRYQSRLDRLHDQQRKLEKQRAAEKCG
jgi:hypothetical protein